MTSFGRIVVIFNPQSTGDAPWLAEELHEAVRVRLAVQSDGPLT